MKIAKSLAVVIWLVIAIMSVHDAVAQPCAAELSIVFGTRSHHLVPAKGFDFNEVHNGIGLKCNDFTIGITKNSYSQPVLVTTFESTKEVNKYYKAGFRYGMMFGYHDYVYTDKRTGKKGVISNFPIMPLFQAVAKTNFNGLNLDLGLGYVSTASIVYNLK